jgi:HEPN domain-containing protein
LLDENEFARWIWQAEHNLESAERDAEDGDFAWACFKVQQAAELAVKALLLGLGQPARGHSVLALLRQVSDLQIDVPQPLLESAQRLDRLYIPTRCPDAHPTGSPFEFYNEADAQQALSDARQERRRVANGE